MLFAHANQLICAGRISKQSAEPFWDSTLSVRVAEVLHDWMVRAQREIEVQSGGMADARAEAVRQIEAKTEELQAILDGVRVDVTDFNLPELPC